MELKAIEAESWEAGKRGSGEGGKRGRWEANGSSKQNKA